MPFSKSWHKVNEQEVPINAVWLSAFIAFCMALTRLSTSARTRIERESSGTAFRERDRKRGRKTSSMDDTDTKEEFEPLFDYTRIQPVNFVCLDDDSLDESTIFIPKKRKFSDAEEEKKLKKDLNVKDVKAIDCDDKEDDEEDWLPPPPKNLDHSSKNLEEDSTLKALRLKRQELASFTESAEELVRAVEESVRKNLSAASKSPPESATKQPPKPPIERSKLVISIQDKDGLKQFRVYKDDKFERLFKMYADKSKLDVKNLVFCFDGDKVSPVETPDSLGMEEDDIIEVHVKSN